MVKFTVSFDNKIIQSLVFDQNVIHIGNNSSSDLLIDSAYAGPDHAVVTQKGHAYFIIQVDKKYPLIINNDNIKEARLINNDKIIIDNYSISFNSAKIIIPNKNDTATKNYAAPLEEEYIIPNANIQILSGKHIGRVISLKNNNFCFGQHGSNTAVISKNTKGYAISAEKKSAQISINQEPLGDSVLTLNDNDMLLIDNISMQFFIEQ